jgi:hypothetical protein
MPYRARRSMAINTHNIINNKTMLCLVIAPPPHPHASRRRMGREPSLVRYEGRETAFGEAREVPVQGGVGTPCILINEALANARILHCATWRGGRNPALFAPLAVSRVTSADRCDGQGRESSQEFRAWFRPRVPSMGSAQPVRSKNPYAMFWHGFSFGNHITSSGCELCQATVRHGAARIPNVGPAWIRVHWSGEAFDP